MLINIIMKRGERMIENYIEKDILRQVKLIEYLFEMKSIPLLDLTTNLKVTSLTLKNDLNKILTYLPENSYSSSVKNNTISISFNQPVQRYDITKKIYSQSQFLKTCAKFIQNKTDYLTLVEEEFISITQAFRLKKKTLAYLKRLNLLDNNENINYTNELQLRNFIISIWIRLGIPTEDLDENILKKAKAFVIHIEDHFKYSLKELEFNILVALSYLLFSRTNKLVFSSSVELKHITSTFFYLQLEKILIKMFPDISFLQYEIGYFAIYMRIISLNQTNYQFLLEDHDYTQSEMLYKYDELHFLIKKFEIKFNIKLQNNTIFTQALTNLIYSTWLDIQTQFVEKHYYLNKNQIIYKNKVISILNNWSKSYPKITFNELAINRFCSLTYSLLGTTKLENTKFCISIVAEDEFSHILFRESLSKWLNNPNIIINNTLYYSIESIELNTKIWTSIILCERSLITNHSLDNIIFFLISRNSVFDDLQLLLKFLYTHC